MSEIAKSDRKKESHCLNDISAFCWAMVKHWHWWTCTTVSSGVAALVTGGGRSIPVWILWLFALSGLVVASFLAFCDQRRITEEGREAAASIERALNESAERNETAQKKQIALLESQVQMLQTQLEDRAKRKKIKDSLAGYRITIQNLTGQLRGIEYYKYADQIRQNFERDFLDFLNSAYGFLNDKIGRSEATTFVDPEKVPKVVIPTDSQFDLESWEDRWVAKTFMLNRLKYGTEQLEIIEGKLDSVNFILPLEAP